MADRISEIKSTLEKLISLLDEELLSQREEIRRLKKSIEQMGPGEKPERAGVVEPLQQRNPEPQSVKETEFSFEPGPEVEIHPTEHGRNPILGELFSEQTTLAEYAQQHSQAWMTDMPGSEVDKVEKAISLNDRMFFVRELFEGDDEQFQLTVERIDETATFKEVVNDMRAAFPEWDETSDAVYRFYMIIRRKFR